ncbi:hypothetical protein SAMN06264364_12943 [Quadrisphaera granulorum]|uniref:Uncharacterized protein n=1 Tax=Quadrisphaera granulorum TaxID=317664 RepID=A0A315ZTM1_9ACTN|nr:hypothetical protein BXY45_12943 [Quadrisphaera granulorum]SZE98384.1 hypothetical protein SAMN06264364_12943 [Quadrisphaera granulorum]
MRPARERSHHHDPVAVAVDGGLSGGWLGHAGAFQAWVIAHGADGALESPEETAAKAPLLWAGVVAAATMAPAAGLEADPTLWTLHDLAALLDLVKKEQPREMVEAVCASLSLYFHYLDDSGAWADDPTRVRSMQAMLDTTLDPDSLLAQISRQMAAAGDVSEEAEDRAVAALPLLADVVAMLGAVRQGTLSITKDAAGKQSLAVDLPEPLAVGGQTGLAHLWWALKLAQFVPLGGNPEDGDDDAPPTLTAAGEALLSDPAGAIDEARAVVSRWIFVLLDMPHVWAGHRPFPRGAFLPLMSVTLLGALAGNGVGRASVDSYCDTLDLSAVERAALAQLAVETLDRLVLAGLAVKGDDEQVVVPGELQSVVQAGVEMAIVISRKS